jgi:inorganic pyrophosphatase
MEVRPVGILHMFDQTENDQKILAVPNRNPRFESIHTIDQVIPHTRKEIEYFFSIYKELQGVKTEMKGWGDPREARKAINESRQNYLGRWIERAVNRKDDDPVPQLIDSAEVTEED